jgi:hypothetical protein
MDSSAQFEPRSRESDQIRSDSNEQDYSEQDAAQLTFCAGLPFIGNRVVTEADQASLRKMRKRSTLIGTLWLMSIPPAVVATLWYLLSPASLDAFVALLIVLDFFFGVPVSLLKARDAFRRARLCSRTMKTASVRVFAGLLNLDDPSDAIRDSLTRAGLLHPETGKNNCIELHASADVIYSINDSPPGRFERVELTTAASAPTNPARFAVPIDWIPPFDRMELTRRRLTPGERTELLNYANDVGTKAAFSVVLICWFGGKALWQVLTKLLAAWPGLGETLSVAIMIGICTQLILRARRRAGELHLESECGWAVSMEPAEAGDAEAGRHADCRDPIIPAEVLSQSGLLWTVRGQPAGWRRAGAKKLFQRMRHSASLK